MDSKLFDKNCITLDGRMDEPVWDEAKVFTDFKVSKALGGYVHPVQTEFKILPCEDRIYIGIKCLEPNMEYVKAVNPQLMMWSCDDIEIFLSPSNNHFDFYQFAITFEGQTAQHFYSEGGNIKPDPYSPEWSSAVYKGEDFWSLEVEFPLTAFYMTPQAAWNTTWLMNISRTRCVKEGNTERRYSTSWCGVDKSGLESKYYLPEEGFPVRAPENDVRMTAAIVDIKDETDNGFVGTMTVRAEVPQDEAYEFTTQYTEPVTVQMKKGFNEFTVPCTFPQCKRYKLAMNLKRISDGVEFKRFYPIRIAYEAIKLSFTSPEFRTNFYPGQDYSKIVGKVICAKPVTLKLEGAGMQTQIVQADAEGNFTFDTSKMEIGEAILTATAGDKEITRKMRRLAPREKMTTWISNGHYMVDGKPVFPRTVSAVGWHGGQKLKKRYEADNLHETRYVCGQHGHMNPDFLLRDLGMPRTDACKDEKPCPEVFAKIDEFIAANQKNEITHYFTCDEPECRGVSPIYLKHIYDYVAEKDPYRLIRISSRNTDGYAEVGDFFETHPYINPYTDENGKRIYGRELNTVGNFIDALGKMNRKDKCIGFLGTCYAAMKGRKDPYPTFDEFICCSWAGIIRGAMSIRQYAYHDINDRAAMYEGTRYVFASVEALEDILLDAKRTTLARNTEHECCLYEFNGEKMFVLASFSQEEQTVTLNELTGTWHNFRHGETITGPTFTLKPLEVLIGTEKVRDAGMPTYQETVALIEKQEADRMANKSLLFERYRDVKVTSSTSVGTVIKMFDGVDENWAWDQLKGDDKFYEVDISKIKPTFNKVVISGYNLDEMVLKLKLGDEYIIPEAEIKDEEFARTYILKEAITADSIRMEFNKPDRVLVELYELEIFKD